MKIYPQYKTSGVDWLGEIPSHWSVARFNYNFETSTGITFTKADITDSGNEVISYGQIHSSDNVGTSISPKLIKHIPNSLVIGKEHCLVETGNFIFADTSEDLDGCGNCVYVDKPIYAGYHTIHAKQTRTNSGKYLSYLFLTKCWRSQIRKSVYGIKVFSITQTILNSTYLLLPPYEEQEAIAEYLDDVTAKIDSLMIEKQAQVEDLRKYRTSLITETVTRGLNPNAPIKQTNSEWFPYIPTNWSIEKFKYQATVKANLVHPTDYTQHPQISPDSIEKNTGRLLGYRTVEEAGIISDNHLFYKGQIIYSKIRPNLNKVIIAPFDGLCSADMYPIETLNNVRYFQYLMLSNPFVSQVSVVIQDRVKMPKINQVELGEILILVPPVSEQQQIADYLDEKIAKIDALIEELVAQLSDLVTYKQAVITEAVTGKVDVRDWVPKN